MNRLLVAVLIVGAATVLFSPRFTRLSPPHHPAAVTPPGEG